MNVVRNEALREGIITQANLRDSRQDAQRKVRQYARSKGYGTPQELAGELTAQKLLRAVYSRNQLREVMTDFWYNHFNVSLTDNQARPYVLSYERDAIRPNALGRFRDLLGATAKHPAMLQYLDNAQSHAPAGSPTLLRQAVQRNPRRAARRQMSLLRAEGAGANPADATGGVMGATADGMTGTVNGSAATPPQRPPLKPKAAKGKAMRKGINENYARELMELHTLGVDGGYTQTDVIEVARVLTGWTLYPQGPRGEQLRLRLARNGERQGFVHAGGFLFRPDVHDAGPKTILGTPFPAGHGLDEGERVLDLLSRHPSTAKFISHKLAVRFVSDAPPKALEDRLAHTFLRTNGDVKAMVRTLVASPEFWAKPARRSKIKSPFELAASSLRALNADVRPSRPLAQWVARMGQPLYAYLQPTGYPDRATAWVSTGSLLTRMNFGLQLASGRVPGVRIDLPALNGNHEPESASAALKTYAALLLPERDLTETLRQLTPMVSDPKLPERVETASPQPEPPANEGGEPSPSPVMEDPTGNMNGRRARPFARRGMRGRVQNAPPTLLQQVVGVLLGSPEFQRR
jgi:uncharacterized protein (DUF1800 family)